jgi:hypothetical protein
VRSAWPRAQVSNPKAAGGRAWGEEEKARRHGHAEEKRWIAARTLQLESIVDRQNATKRLAASRRWMTRSNMTRTMRSGGRCGKRRRSRPRRIGPRGSAAAGPPSSSTTRAIRRCPDNFGAHHYLIHSCEMVGLFEEALKHGAVLGNAASA